MLRCIAVIAGAVMMFAICIALGEVRITSNFAGTEVATALDDIAQPVIGMFSAGTQAVQKQFTRASDDLPPRRNAAAAVQTSHVANHHSHQHKLHVRG